MNGATSTFGDFVARHGLFVTESDHSIRSKKAWTVDPETAIEKDFGRTAAVAGATGHVQRRGDYGIQVKPGIGAWDAATCDPGVADLGSVADREKAVAFQDMLIAMTLNRDKTMVFARKVRDAERGDEKLTTRHVVEVEERDVLLPLNGNGTPKRPGARLRSDIATLAEIRKAMREALVMAHAEDRTATRVVIGLMAGIDDPLVQEAVAESRMWGECTSNGTTSRFGDDVMERICKALELRGHLSYERHRKPWRRSSFEAIPSKLEATTPGALSSTLRACWQAKVAGDQGRARRQVEAFAALVEGRREAFDRQKREDAEAGRPGRTDIGAAV